MVNIWRTAREIFIHYSNRFQDDSAFQSTPYKSGFITMQLQLWSGKIFLWSIPTTWHMPFLQRGRKCGNTACLAILHHKTSKLSGYIARKRVIGSKGTLVIIILSSKSLSQWVSTAMTLLLTRGLKLDLSQFWGGVVTLLTRILRLPGTSPLQYTQNMLLQSGPTTTSWGPLFRGCKICWTVKCFMSGLLMATCSCFPAYKVTSNSSRSITIFTTIIPTNFVLSAGQWKNLKMETCRWHWQTSVKELPTPQAFQT